MTKPTGMRFFFISRTFHVENDFRVVIVPFRVPLSPRENNFKTNRPVFRDRNIASRDENLRPSNERVI